MSHVIWEETSDQGDILTPVVHDARPFERDIINLLDEVGLIQINSKLNSQGRILDVGYAKNSEQYEQKDAEVHFILRPSKHHIPISCDYCIKANSISDMNSETTTRKITNHIALDASLKKIMLSLSPIATALSMSEINRVNQEIETSCAQATRSIV